MKKIFRISDHRNGATLIDGISKYRCFYNFLDIFGHHDTIIVADKVKPETKKLLASRVKDVHHTSLGNSKSFVYALDLAVQQPDDEIVYLVEDDYLHLPDAEQILIEGVERADYVSLYDHPDKYMSPGPNPLVRDGGEASKVILTRSTHWKYTNSTTMTFAAKAGTLKQDYNLLKQHCEYDIPLDFRMFTHLLQRGRKLITPIPGRSTHCDHFPSPFFFDRSPNLQPHLLMPANQDSGINTLPVPVIIPFYKHRHQLEKCLQHLNQQTVPVEVFVRDNSVDNIYFTAAVNEGIKKYLDRDCRYLILLNQDMYLAKDAVAEMVKFMESHPCCGIGSPLQLDPENPASVIYAGGLNAWPLGQHQHGRLADLTEDAPIVWGNGACMILRKEMVLEIGLLDKNLVFFASDSDYSFSARARGWQMWRIAKARGIHDLHGAGGATDNQDIELLKLNDLYYFAKKWLTGESFKEMAYEGQQLTPEIVTNLVTELKKAIHMAANQV
jgi:GT2 family glycosyltransferase